MDIEKEVLNVFDCICRKEIKSLEAIVAMIEETNDDFITQAEFVLTKNVRKIGIDKEFYFDLMVKASRLAYYRSQYIWQYEKLKDYVEKLPKKLEALDLETVATKATDLHEINVHIGLSYKSVGFL